MKARGVGVERGGGGWRRGAVGGCMWGGARWGEGLLGSALLGGRGGDVDCQ